jgi:hypothetical protein
VNQVRIHSVVSSGLALLVAGFVVAAGPGAASGVSTHSASAQSPSAASVVLVSSVSRSGRFTGANGKHVAGTVTISGGNVVLSGFSSDAGPDLHIYLTSGAGENDVTAGKQLGKVSYNQASQTFSLGGIDPAKYTTVVIHCDKAKAVFGDAPLS